MDDSVAHHVLAVLKDDGRTPGGLSAQCHVPLVHAQSVFDSYVSDDRYLRVQWISVDRQGVVVVHRDETYPDRVAHPDDWRRIQRLDDLNDATVSDVRSRRPKIPPTPEEESRNAAEREEDERFERERLQREQEHERWYASLGPEERDKYDAEQREVAACYLRGLTHRDVQ